jgi:hypothetical protein
VQKAESLTKGLQTKGISLPTWDTHRGMSVTPPCQHRRDTEQATNEEGRRKKEACGRQKARAASEDRQGQAITRQRFSFLAPSSVRCPPFRVSVPPLDSRGRSPSPHSCAGAGLAAGVEPDWRWRRGSPMREREPPEQSLAYPGPRPKLEALLHQSAAKPDGPLDPQRL